MSNVYNLWLLDRKSGLCVFEQNFEEWPGKNKSDIVAGFLYAILNISKELAEDIVSYIQLKNKFRISYRLSDNIIYVILSSQIEQGWIENVLERLEKRFEKKFTHLHPGSNYGEMTQFQSFAQDAEEILQLETKYISYIKNRSEHLDEYVKRACKEWQHFQKIFASHQKKVADWTIKESVEIDAEVQDDITENRKNAKMNLDKSDDNSRGSWI